MENQEKNEGQLTLTPKQEMFLKALIDASDLYYDGVPEGRINGKDLEKKSDEITVFGKELTDNGLEPRDYILWHKLVGSSLLEGKKYLFDTPNGDVEKFARKHFEIKD